MLIKKIIIVILPIFLFLFVSVLALTGGKIDLDLNPFSEEKTTQEEAKVEKTYENTDLTVYLFYSETCPYCHKAIDFLEKEIEPKYDNVQIKYLETNDPENRAKWVQAGNLLGKEGTVVPYTVIGDEVIEGFGGASTTGQQFENRIDSCLENGCEDSLESLFEE
jgi:glutaredoxin